MTDKILKEAFDRLTAIEEGDYEDYKKREGNINKQHAERGDTTLDYVGGDDRYNKQDDTPYDLDEGRMEDEEGIDVLEEIQGRLFEVIEDLTDAIRGYHPSQLSYWQSYGLAQLKIVAGSDEYATHDKSINSLIEEIREELSRGGPEDEMDDGYMDDPAGEDSMGESEETDRMRKDLDTIRQRTNPPAEEPRRRPRTSRRRGTGAADQSMRQR